MTEAVAWRTEVKPSDAPAVQALVERTGFFSREEQDVARELVDETLARGPASGYEFVFADLPGQPAELPGYTCYGLIPATRSSYDLYWIAVAPSQQGKGLGRRLLRETERLAVESGATQMFAETSGRPQYAPTRAFYERMGYQVAALLKDFYAPGDDKVIFARRL
jgi:ribosomal protein S18 acetylase RimI-like enzyme